MRFRWREFRPDKITEPEYRHILLLLFWPVYGLAFLFVERLYTVDAYTPIHCALDDKIPFCEYFLIPYMFWFVYLIGTLVYTFFLDIGSFRRLMWFIIITNTATILIYLLFPTCQELRPAEFPRDNFMTRLVESFYGFDTNTNVCPSIHVSTTIGVMAAAWHSERLGTTRWRIAYAAAGLLICASTLFLRQHSVIDAAAAAALSLPVYFICFRGRKSGKSKKRRTDAGSDISI